MKEVIENKKSPEERAAEAVDANEIEKPEVEPSERHKVFKPQHTEELLNSSPPQKPAALPNKSTDITVREGVLLPMNLSEATRIADGLLKSGCIPRQYDSVPKILMGMQVLSQLGLPNIACLPKLAIINGAYSLWGEGPKALCQPEIEDFDEFWFDEKYEKICFENKNLGETVSGALCRVKRKGIPTWVERTFTVGDAVNANLWGKVGPWKQYPKRMLQMKARGWVLKDAFPDKLMGASIAEYEHDVIVDAIGEVATNQAPALVQRFKSTNQ